MILKCRDCETEFDVEYGPKCPVCDGYATEKVPADLPQAGASAQHISSVKCCYWHILKKERIQDV